MTTQVLHILNDGPDELSDQIIDAHSRECKVEVVDLNKIEVVDLNKKEISYEELIEKIFSCEQVVSW